MLPLIADADINSGATVVTVGLAALAGLFSWLNARELRLSKKDQLDADAEKATMKADIKACKEDREELRQDREELRGRVKRLEDLLRPSDRSGPHAALPPIAPTP